MIKFAKWMYELGYNAAIKNVLHEVDTIPNAEPNESTINARSEEIFKRKLNNARIVYDERKHFKDFIHKKFDKDYKPAPDMKEIMKKLELDR